MDKMKRLREVLAKAQANAETWEEVMPFLDEIQGAIHGLDAARDMLKNRLELQLKTGAFEAAEKTRQEIEENVCLRRELVNTAGELTAAAHR